MTVQFGQAPAVQYGQKTPAGQTAAQYGQSGQTPAAATKKAGLATSPAAVRDHDYQNNSTTETGIGGKLGNFFASLTKAATPKAPKPAAPTTQQRGHAAAATKATTTQQRNKPSRKPAQRTGGNVGTIGGGGDCSGCGGCSIM